MTPDVSAPYDELMDLAAIGGEGTSVTRLAWSQPLRAAYRWLEDRCADLGLDCAGRSVMLDIGDLGHGPGCALSCVMVHIYAL